MDSRELVLETQMEKDEAKDSEPSNSTLSINSKISESAKGFSEPFIIGLVEENPPDRNEGRTNILGCGDEAMSSFLEAVSLLKKGGTCEGPSAHIQGKYLSPPKKDNSPSSPPVTVSAMSVVDGDVSPTKVVELDSGEHETEVEEMPPVKKSSRKAPGAEDVGAKDKKDGPGAFEAIKSENTQLQVEVTDRRSLVKNMTATLLARL
ncbi:hypothetical protein K7X08_035905 [Anisodus acutangulus]|uniref:Uncharacterized protein n=1 Tax=Anisodus acutangulus TaxID=402998 RepID=A0A9Q1L650_9SOLA|nr:hypothetical protein K7X08_035905 [Anisodus acutangulus]